MPSALETLVKVLKLEQDTGYQDKAVIGGLQSFAEHWAADAHAQAKKPEHHILVDELTSIIARYNSLAVPTERHEAVKYMLGRITGRIPPREGSQQQSASSGAPQEPTSIRPSAARPTAEQEHISLGRSQSQSYDESELDEIQVAPQRPSEADDEVIINARRDGPAQQAEAARANHPARHGRRDRDARRPADVRANLRESVAAVSGIGPKMAETLAQLGIFTVEDLLYFFPRRYDDYTQMLPLNRLQPDQTLTVIGTVRNNAIIKSKRGLDVLSVTIDDGAGLLTASFFGQPYLRNKLERGVQVVFSGKTELFRGKVTMSNPEWELLERDALHTRSIVPVYSLTKGLTNHNMRRFIRAALDQWTPQLTDYMPISVLDRMDLPDLDWSLQQIHFPSSWDAINLARRRLAFDELILLQLGVLDNRRVWQSQPGQSMTVSDEWLDGFAATLPYTLTSAQVRAIQAIRKDMSLEVPMNRLLQGDVGSGKTIVAATSMAVAVASGYQAALMAPTSILAEQHYQSLSRILANISMPEPINVKLLTGATPPQERADILWGLGEGSIQVVVGTHALIEGEVNFARLGIAIIDEQHRFGVEQRGRLRGKGVNPHVLIMTATPIPRTLALTVHADLDLTVLDEMPPGRTPVDTMIVQPNERERAYSFIEAQLEKGQQAFIVYPLVEESESEALADVGSAVEEYERLHHKVFHHYKVGLLHGRMSPAEKDEVMAAFSEGEINVLVSTSVVEVGIDVPNASVMLVEGANRFGLAQLHQFRGRVGRGQHASFCLLIPDKDTEDNARLKAMEATTDGFALAEMDWKMRGAGDMLGTRQSGGQVYLTEYMDPRLVDEAQTEARTLYEEDPDLSLPEHAALRDHLRQTFGDRTGADFS